MTACIVTENLDHARIIRDELTPGTESSIVVTIYSYKTLLGLPLYEVIINAPLITVLRMDKWATVCVADPANGAGKDLRLETGTFKTITLY